MAKKSRRGFLVTTLIDSKRELMLLPCFTLILMHLHFHEIILFSIHSVMYENQKNLVKTQVCMNQNATSGKSLTHCGSGLAALGALDQQWWRSKDPSRLSFLLLFYIHNEAKKIWESNLNSLRPLWFKRYFWLLYFVKL